MRLIDGEVNRVLSRAEAEALSEETGLDLVVMSLASDPPVVQLTDYGRFKFESEKKAREAKKKQHVVSVKEIKMGIRIDEHDYEVKKNRAYRFLEEGNKVKCTIRLKGREVQHSNLAFDLGKRFVADLEDVGTLEGRIRQESFRIITMNFNPEKKSGAPKIIKQASSPKSSDTVPEKTAVAAAEKVEEEEKALPIAKEPEAPPKVKVAVAAKETTAKAPIAKAEKPEKESKEEKENDHAKTEDA